MLKEDGFLSFVRKYRKQLFSTALDALKTATKKIVHKTGEFLGNRIADAVTKSGDDKIVKQEPVEEIIISPEKRVEISIIKIETSIIKMEHCKISNLLNYSTVSKFVTKSGSK